MMVRLLLLALLLSVIGTGKAVALQTETCSVDVGEVTDLLEQAQTALGSEDNIQALARLRHARDVIEAMITRCEPATSVALTESTILRGALSDGDIILNYPQRWQVALGEGELTLTEDAPVDGAITGVLTAFPLESLLEYDLKADDDTANILETLSLRMVDSMDESALQPATLVGDNAILVGTVTEDGQTIQVAFAATKFETALAFLFLTSSATESDVSSYAEAIIASLEFVAD